MEQNKIVVITVIIAVLIVAPLILFVYAYDEGQEPGITPDSILYGFDVFVDETRVIMAASPLEEIKIRLDIIEERVNEMVVMFDENKTEEAEIAELEGQKQIEKFEDSMKKVKKKDADELNEYIQTNAAKLEILKQRLRDSDSGLADAIADALEILKTAENIIVNIPEDLDPESTFIIGSGPLGPANFESMIALCIETGGPLEYCERLEEMCGEMGAPTVNECLKMIAETFVNTELKFEPLSKIPEDPHGCDGSYSDFITQTKYCCTDSDGRYSPEYVERIISEERYSPEYVGSTISEGREVILNYLNYYHRKGTVEYKIINLKTGEIEEGIETDSCDGDTLTEWRCPTSLNGDTLNKRYSEEYSCPNGCEDGACIE